MLSARHNNYMRRIYEAARACARCHFASPVFLTRARNAENAAYRAIRTQDLADYEHMHNMYSQLEGAMEPGYHTNSDEELGYSTSSDEEEKE